MAATLINGSETARSVNAETAEEVQVLQQKFGVRPALAVVLVGEDPASQVYVSRKVAMCAELGIRSEKIVLPSDTSQEELLRILDRLNSDPEIHGILVQSPTPKQIDERAVVLSIDPRKDVDCFHPFNVGNLLLGDLTGFLPCTPWGVTVLLERYGIRTAGKHAVVLGRSNIVGKPMAALLMAKAPTGDATVTVCHSKTENLDEITRSADIIVAALGIPRFLKGHQVKEGVVVIDVGINRIADPTAKRGCRLVGDVDFASVEPKASFITPVPGGVGPMTIAMLMKNTLRACRAQMSK